MKKISKNEAIRMMSNTDFKVYEQELAEFVNWSLENQKEFTEDFYLDGDTLILYFVNEGLNYRPRIVFEGKKVGRPSLGTTKKVSLTLADYIWNLLEEAQKKNPTLNSKSSVLRSLIERHFEPNRHGEKIVLVPVETKLIKEIQEFAVNSDEIYDSQVPEDMVHNILNKERLRLKKL